MVVEGRGGLPNTYIKTDIALLAGGAGIAAAAAKWLEVRGKTPGEPPAAPAFLAFGACLLLAFLAGRRAPKLPHEERIKAAAGGPVSGARRIAALVLLIASVLLFAVTWVLQGRSPVPLGVLATWAGSLAAAGVAFALVTSERTAGHRRWRNGVGLVALFPLLALGAWCRLAGLREVPPGLGGDEANQIQDAVGLLTGSRPGDPFGAGWYGTMRLGMLPAGIGALASSDPVVGPRLPYAVAGTLSFFAAAAAGGLLGGIWGALGTAALLAVAPHHVHFSRIASVMILDALLAALLLLLLLRTRVTGSPVSGFFAAATAGLALYGYSAGRIVPAVFLAASPFLIRSAAARDRRGILAFALAAGFLLAAAPNLRFAARHFDDWNSRLNQVGIFRKAWWGPEVQKFGSPARVLNRQIAAGTVGLLSGHTSVAWFTGYPIVAPYLLPAFAAAGFGWLLGRRRYFASLVLALLVAGNLAAVILADSAPSPQRLSSLFPALAVLAGAAVSGFVSLLPSPASGGAPWRAAVGALLLAGALLPSVGGLPPWSDPSPGYGGDHGALALAASKLLAAPRYRQEAVVLDGLPYLDSTFPSFSYLLPGTTLRNRNPDAAGDARPPAGFHLISPEWMSLAAEWRRRYGVAHAVPLPDPRDPRRDIGLLLRLP